MSARRPSALSDLIRQATTTSEVSEGIAAPDASTTRQNERPPQRVSTNGVPATAEELAEAFFPGSSIREHAFFPKSLTHSQQSHSQTRYGFLGSFKPGQWAPSDGAQVAGNSPPGAYGSVRGGSSVLTAGGAASAATSHSLHRQQSNTHASIAEGDEAGSDEGRQDDTSGGSPSNQASGPQPGSSSWYGWHLLQQSAQSLPVAQPSRRQVPTQMAGSVTQAAAIAAHSLPKHAGQHPAHHQLAQSPPSGHPEPGRRHRSGSQQAAGQSDGELTVPLLLGFPDASNLTNPADVEAPLLSPTAAKAAATAATAAGAAAAAAVASAARQHSAFGTSGNAAALAQTAEAAAPAPVGRSTLSADLRRRRSGFFNAAVFGFINAVVSMPTLIAYAAIVFKAPIYTPYLDSLCRFFFFSSAIHQLVFVGLSTLTFAIGQVQDVGLIFLSAMATDIALRVTGPGAAEVALGSSLLIMTISTFIVGLLTVIVARLKLADMVSYMPLPVVGGYLGFVGYFCIAGGTALAAGVQVDTLSSWVNIFALDPVLRLIPAAATIIVLMLCVEHISHPLALPGLLTIIPLIFHGVLWYIGWDLEKAQETGWVMRPTAGLNNCWQLWSLFNLQNGGLAHGVSMPAMLAQLPKLAGLFLVVCFGSCMDVAAIQSDMPTPLDFNRELMTVGVSNMVTGLMGAGYTGSYIFSQTVFTMRQGVFSRVNGLAVAIVELLVFALPFSVVQYMPNFFFGALLVWFGIEISRDWLILSYKKLSRAEYVLLLATLLAIMNLGLELGIAAGVVMATLYFAFQYAQSQVSSLRQVAARSSRTHMYDTSSALDLLGRRMAVLRLSGYIFFGSSTGLSNQVLQRAARMLQERAEEALQHEEWALSAEQRDGRDGEYSSRAESLTGPMAVPPVSASAPAAVLGTGAQQHPPATTAVVTAANLSNDANAREGSGGGAARPVAEANGNVGSGTGAMTAPRNGAAGGDAGGHGGSEAEGDGALTPADRHWMEAKAVSAAPVVLILDFGSVSGLDSTAARTFATLVNTLSSQRVNVIFTNMRRPYMRKLLAANGLPLRPFAGVPPVGGQEAAAVAVAAANGAAGDVSVVGGDGGSAKHAERRSSQLGHLPVIPESPLLRPSAGGCWEFPTVTSAVGCCEDAYLGLAMAVGLLGDAPSQAASLQQLLTRNLREVVPAAAPDVGALVASLEGALTRKQLQLGDVLYGCGSAVREVYMIEFGALVEEEHYEGGVRVGAREHGAGVVVGALEFFLSRPAPATVRCSSTACQVLCISRATFASLMAHNPRALSALQVLLMRSACMDLASAQEAANHAAAA